MKTKIEWTDFSWNPIIGCTKVSPGCEHCYAERMANRLAHNPKAPAEYKKVINSKRKWNNNTEQVPESFLKPFSWKKPRMIFVCSMSDLFHENNSWYEIASVFIVMKGASDHTYLILTKRPQQALDYFRDKDSVILPNIWLGVTAENQEQADKRIPILLKIPAAKRFVSIEPMLSKIELRQNYVDYLTGWETIPDNNGEMMQSQTEKLDWVILGGETGPGARPMHPDWVRSVRDQCQANNVPFFFKSWGGINRKEYLIDGKEWREMP